MKRKRKRKQDDPRQLQLPFPLPSPPPDDISPKSEIKQKRIELPPSASSQPYLIGFPWELNPDFFHWPTTNAPIGSGQVANTNWEEMGLLGYFGYMVGLNGKLKSHRRTILARVFELNEIPGHFSIAYRTEWGGSRSAKRLRKMAESIAAFCRAAKRKRRANMRRAIENYEDDLAWLKKEYYDGHFDSKFRWPQT